MERNSTLVSSKRQAVIQELIGQAIEVFSSRGYRASSMNDLADKAGLSKSTLYHYFGGKEDLLVAIFDLVMIENAEALRRIEASEQSPADTLRDLLAERVVYACNNRRILKIIHEEEDEIPRPLVAKVRASRRAYQRAAEAVLVRGLADGVFEFDTTPTIVATSLLGACIWPYRWYEPEGVKTPEELGAEMSGLLIRAVLPMPR
jgi:AcrR family transcriptional regulator